MKSQRGFFLIVAVLLLLVIGFIGVTFVSMFSGEAGSVNNLNQSDQAYFIAASGLEVARHNIIVNGETCASITGGLLYTNYAIGKGTYTVTGTANSAATTLSAAVAANATSLPLASATGLLSQGVVMIGSEIINYDSISGNTLMNVTRGLQGTVAAAYSSGSAVTQNVCVLTSTGSVPSVSNRQGGRTLMAFLPISSGSYGITVGSTMVSPTLTVGSNVSLANTSNVSNPSVTANSANFKGSTILTSSGTVNINNSATTSVNSASGIVTSSSAGSIQNDIWLNNSTINSGNLFSYFFNKSALLVQLASNQTYTASNINGVTGQMIWTSDLSLNSGTTIGTASSPVILIVNGNLNMSSGPIVIYGFVYTVQGLSMGSGTSIIGAAVSANPANLNGSASITLNNSVLVNTSTISSDVSYITTSGSVNIPVAIQEVF